MNGTFFAVDLLDLITRVDLHMLTTACSMHFALSQYIGTEVSITALSALRCCTAVALSVCGLPFEYMDSSCQTYWDTWRTPVI